MVTITTFQSLPEAFLLQSILKGSGIESFIPDELTVLNDWTLINAIGGIRLQVDINDLQAAQTILNDYRKNQNAEN